MRPTEFPPGLQYEHGASDAPQQVQHVDQLVTAECRGLVGLCSPATRTAMVSMRSTSSSNVSPAIAAA